MRTAIRHLLRVFHRAPACATALVLGLAAAAATASEALPQQGWIGSEVVVKDLFFQPRLGTAVVNPAVREHRFHVAAAQGRWLWVVARDTHGWLRDDEVVPLSAAVSYFSAVILSHPYSAHAYYLRGLIWAEEHEPDIAIADFTAAIKRDSQNAWAFHNRGMAYSEKAEYRKAIADYSEAIRLNGLDAAAYNNRGLAHDRLGEYDKAIADYSEAIRHYPHLINAYYNRAGVLAEQGEEGRAAAEYDFIVRHVPNDADAHARLAWLLATSPERSVRDPRRALEHATLATLISGEKVALHLEALAAAQAALKEWEKATQAQAQAAALLPEGSEERARALARLKRYQQKQPAPE